MDNAIKTTYTCTTCKMKFPTQDDMLEHLKKADCESNKNDE